MKKILIVLFVLISIIGTYLAWDYFQTKRLSRNYPDFLKCSWVSNYKIERVTNNLSVYDKLGLNAACVMVEVPEFSDSRPSFIQKIQEFRTKSAIKAAKRQGNAVFIALDTAKESAYSKVSKEEYLSTVEKEALRWAKITESLQVEYFAPLNEIDGKLYNPEDWFTGDEEVATQERVKAVNRWHKSVLPKIKKVYSGKLVAKFADPIEGLEARGYDLVSMTLDHYQITDLEEFREKTRDDYRKIVEIAEKSESDWIAGEVYYPTKEEGASEEISLMYEKAREKLIEYQDDYFRISIEEIFKLSEKARPKGYIPSGYGGTGTELEENIKSEEVIRDFLTSI